MSYFACDGHIDSSRSISIREAADLWISAGGDPSVVNTMVAVAKAESQLDPDA